VVVVSSEGPFASEFEIDGRTVGQNAPVYIIAEAGVAHFGDEEKAFRLVDLAADAGADAVKFQVFNIDAMISRSLQVWRNRLGKRCLPNESFARIQAYCRTRGITFFATAHDEPSLEFLISLDVPVFKIGSGEVGNWAFYHRIAQVGRPVFFSVGMFEQDQIAHALSVFRSTNNRQVAILHCITDYPTPPTDVALGNIYHLRKTYEMVVGYSDHTMGYHIPLAAVALGARVIEKHITIDYNVPDAQDWKVSCGPDDLAKFVHELRDIEGALGMRLEGPTEDERNNMKWAVKRLVAAHDLTANRKLAISDLKIKRAARGIGPERLDDVIGRRLVGFKHSDEPINPEDLK